MTAAFNCLEESRRDPYPAFLTWNICYEFRDGSSPTVAFVRLAWSPQNSWRFHRDAAGVAGVRDVATDGAPRGGSGADFVRACRM